MNIDFFWQQWSFLDRCFPNMKEKKEKNKNLEVVNWGETESKSVVFIKSLYRWYISSPNMIWSFTPKMVPFLTLAISTVGLKLHMLGEDARKSSCVEYLAWSLFSVSLWLCFENISQFPSNSTGPANLLSSFNWFWSLFLYVEFGAFQRYNLV